MAYIEKKNCAACIHCNTCKYKENYEQFDISDYIIEPIKAMLSDVTAVIRLDCKSFKDKAYVGIREGGPK